LKQNFIGGEKMGWFDKYCEKCGMKVDKKTAPQRFGKYFCSEKHAEEYVSDRLYVLLFYQHASSRPHQLA